MPLTFVYRRADICISLRYLSSERAVRYTNLSGLVQYTYEQDIYPCRFSFFRESVLFFIRVLWNHVLYMYVLYVYKLVLKQIFTFMSFGQTVWMDYPLKMV